jgi:hypothetical protein
LLNAVGVTWRAGWAQSSAIIHNKKCLQLQMLSGRSGALRVSACAFST